MSLLECKNVAIGYDGKRVLEGINFSIEEGDYVCIIGENGAGKSTLVKTLLGLLPLIEGTVTLDDSINNSHIGYLPQQTVVQKDFPASVWEIVLSGCLSRCGLRPWYNKIEKALAMKNIEQLGISHLRSTCYRELSGGQQQRVLLARALCATQKILLLDEPVSGLDPKVAAEMYEVINELNSKGITIIMISHDVSVATEHAKSVLCINKTVVHCTKKDFLANIALSNTYITRSN